MPLKIEDIKVKGYERVIHATNATTKLDCVIAIHNTKLGPSLGGVRSWEYTSFENQKKDALRLSEAMTLKNSVCGINFGGGKATLNLNNIKKTRFKNKNNIGIRYITQLCLILQIIHQIVHQIVL